jgi:ribbon-helix-helix CopG family protein
MSHAYITDMRTTVRLPEDLLRRAKRKAAAEGRTLTALIEDGLRSVVDESPKPMRRKRVVLPVSKARGWLKPGVDLTRFSDYQEMEDLEYIERLRNFK